MEHITKIGDVTLYTKMCCGTYKQHVIWKITTAHILWHIMFRHMLWHIIWLLHMVSYIANMWFCGAVVVIWVSTLEDCAAYRDCYIVILVVVICVWLTTNLHFCKVVGVDGFLLNLVWTYIQWRARPLLLMGFFSHLDPCMQTCCISFILVMLNNSFMIYRSCF
jgi:hypothetical protein